MDRMSALDATFLHIEDGNNPMHIGSVVVFEGPAPAYGDVVRMVSRKLQLVPRYRQRVRFVPLGLGRPVWVDDPHFTILYHIRHTALPSPGGSEEVRNLAGRIFAQRLDRARPLWELWLVEGLAGGRWALIAKTHHAMVDGVAGTDLLTVLLDSAPQPPDLPQLSWTAAPEPSAMQLLSEAVGDAWREPLAQVGSLPLAARAGVTGLGEVLEAARAIGAAARGISRPTVPGLNGAIGPHRRWSWARGDLTEVREIRAALGGTVNDVVLATITRGFRDLLLNRGVDLERRVVRTLVPVSMRREHERGVHNNRVSGVFPDLPVGESDPRERLRAIGEQMAGLKESRQAVAGDALTRLGGYAPPMLLSLGARLAIRLPQWAINTVTTNVPGPRTPLYLGGRRMVEAFPYVPIGGRLRIGVAIFSYLTHLNFGVTGDYESVPDIEVLVGGIEAGMAELLELARATKAPAPTPRTRRRRAAA